MYLFSHIFSELVADVKIGLLLAALRQRPGPVRIQVGKMGIRLVGVIDEGHLRRVAQGKELLVNGLPADDENVLGAVRFKLL